MVVGMTDSAATSRSSSATPGVMEVDDLTVKLRRSDRRSTFGLTVDRDSSVELALPTEASIEEAREFVERKLFWVYSKLEEQTLYADATAREYVDGEGFYYLGRHLRLAFREGAEAVHIDSDRLVVPERRRSDVENAVPAWYKEKAREWLPGRIRHFADRVGAEPDGLTVRDLGYHWGSCGSGDRVYVHWKTMMLPPPIADYVVAHEVVHLVEPHHGDAFWERLHRCMPNYRERKRWLDEHGARYAR